MTAPVRPTTMCAGCGAIVSRHEDCPECGEDPNADTMPCEDCDASGRLTLRICRKPPVAMLSPDDGVEEVDEPCGFCAGHGEVSRPFARASELWAEGFEEALRVRQEYPAAGGRMVCKKHYADGFAAGLAYLDSLPAHQGFEPPPRPVFRTTVEQLDLWAMQGAEWRLHIKGLCPGCGFPSADVLMAELLCLPEPVCGHCMRAFCLVRRGLPGPVPQDLRATQENYSVGWRQGHYHPLWRRFDRGEMARLDFRLNGGAA